MLQAQRGDPRAFETLVSPHWQIAHRIAYVITRDTTDAEDAAQAALLKAWRAIGRFRAGEPLRPWLLKIVANEARNQRRTAGRRAHLALRAQAHEPSGGAAPSPEEHAVAADERRRLLEALESLSETDRLVLSARYLLELSEEETAAALGVRRGTVKSRTARALDRLREAHA